MKHVPWIWHCFPVGRSFRKSITLYELPSPPFNAWHLYRLETGMSSCVWEPCHPDRWPDSLCQSDTMSIRFSFQKLKPTKQCFHPQNEKSDIAGLHHRVILGKSSNAGTEETRRQRKENTHEYHCHNSVGKGLKSINKAPTLCCYSIALIFFKLS